MFNSLGENVVDKIVEKFLRQLAARLASRDVKFTYDTKAISYIHEHSFDPVYGARPIRRYVQGHVETPIASRLIAGSIYKSVTLSADDNGLIFLTDN